MTPKLTLFAAVAATVAACCLALMVAATPASAINPHIVSTYEGSFGAGQSAAALAVIDNTGSQDNWTGYIEFSPGATRHSTSFYFQGGQFADGQQLQVDLNYRGPEFSEVRWRMVVRNYEKGIWEEVFLNRYLNEWEWTLSSASFANAEEYLDQWGRVRLHWYSSSPADVGQLDHLAISIVDPPPPPTNPVDVAPHIVQTYQGTFGDDQVATALDVVDNFGNDDNWLGYIEFSPDAVRHATSFWFPTGQLSATEPLQVSLNYRGPGIADERWVLLLWNVADNRWEEVFLNHGIPVWEWTAQTKQFENSADYTDQWGRVRLHWYSGGNFDVAQLDHLALTVSDNSSTAPTATPTPTPPPLDPVPANVAFDYQIGEPYALPSGVGVVSRDWFDASPAANAYNICYVNAFQTQGNYDLTRPDARDNWPANLVLGNEDPVWGGEYLIDLSTSALRTQAAAHVQQMIQGCADKGYDAVEYDNLDSWTRFDSVPEITLPFDRSDAIAYAELITDAAHGLNMAVGQKNTASLTATEALTTIGFDFAIVESCGLWNECNVFTGIYGDQVVAIEYSVSAFNNACAAVGSQISVVLRDQGVTAPSSPNTYVRDEC